MRTKREFRPNAKDTQLILDCYRFRYLTQDLLCALHVEKPRPGRKYGFSKWALRARLKKLTSEGYLKRYYFTDLRTDEPYQRQSAIYGVGGEALDLVVSFTGHNRELLQEQVARRVGSPFLRHTVGINRFHIGLLSGARVAGGGLELLDWQEGVERLKHRFWREKRRRGEGESERNFYTLVPDAFFVLRRRGEAPRHFFLEYDRGTESAGKRFRSKLALYLWYFEKGIFRQKYFYGKREGTEGPNTSKIQVLDDGVWPKLSARDKKAATNRAIPGFTVLILCAATRDDWGRREEGGEPPRFRQELLVKETTNFLRSRTRRMKDQGQAEKLTARVGRVFWFATEVDLGDPVTEPLKIFGRAWRQIEESRRPTSLI